LFQLKKSKLKHNISFAKKQKAGYSSIEYPAFFML
jgi:hypothetical protein